MGPDELAERAESIIDGEQIRDMVTYLGARPIDAPAFPELSMADEAGKMHFYSCKNLSPSGDCSAYETRPRMCVDYPYGDKCGYTDCTLQEGDES